MRRLFRSDWLVLAAGFLAACVVTGCNSSGDSLTSPPAANAPEEAAAANGHAAAAAPIKPEEVKLVVGDEKKLEEMIAAHKGKVVFVDYWATWCHPCVEYFPHTVEMSKKYKDQGLQTIAVTFDDVADENVPREFLAQQGADFENLLCSYEPGPEAFEKFEVDQVPHFRLYDNTGKLRHKWDAKPEDAEKRIEELLAEEAPAAE